MKLSEIMAKKVLLTDYEGLHLPDAIVVGINPVKQGTTTIANFLLFRQLIENISPTYTSETEEKTYYYDGKSTIKTGVNVEITISGIRYEGDEAQDLVIKNVFSVGKEAIFEVVWFNAVTGKGKIGLFTIDPSQFEGGDAGASGSPFEVKLVKTGIVPVDFDYSTHNTKTFQQIVNPED